MSGARVLVAGVGNVLLRDDGFGVEVVRRLAREPMPEGIRVADFGIRALHLAYELLEGYETLIIVDAMSRGEAPGTVFVFEPERAEPETDAGATAGAVVDPHGLYPGAVLRMALDLGASVGTVRVIGCEPADLGEGIGLTAPVERAVDEAARIVRELATRALDDVMPVAPASAGSNKEKENANVEKEASQ